MKILLFILVVSFNGLCYSQQILNCRFEYSGYKNSKSEFYNLDSIDEKIKNNLNHYVINRTDSLFDNITFIKGQKIYKGSEFDAHYSSFSGYPYKRSLTFRGYFINPLRPKFEFLYKFTNVEYGIEYCFNVLTDKKGRVANNAYFPKVKLKGQYLISMDTAQCIVDGNCENINLKPYPEFSYDSDKKCFVWIVIQYIPHDSSKYLGKSHYFIINAHNGKIIEKGEHFLLYE